MILFTHFSMLILAVSLLCLVALIEVLRSSHSDIRRTWLVWHLVATSVFNLMLLLDDASYSLGPRLFYYLEYPTILAAAVLYGELSYAVAGLSGSSQLKVYRVIVAVMSMLWAAGLYYAISIEADYAGIVYARLHLLPISLFVWPVVIFMRRLREDGVPVFRPAGFFRAIQALSDNQKAMVGFLVASLLRIISSATPVLGQIPNAPWEFVFGLFAANNMLIVVVMVVTYFAFIERRANLASRIASILSVMILLAFVSVVLLFFTDQREMRQQDVVLLQQNSIVLKPTPEGYRAELQPRHWPDTDKVRLVTEANKPVQVNLSFEFPFFGKSYDSLHIYQSGQIALARASEPPARLSLLDGYECLTDKPVIAVFCRPDKKYAVYLADTGSERAIIWAEEGVLAAGQQEPAFQVQIRASGVLVLSYGLLPQEKPAKRWNAIGLHDGTNWPPPVNGLGDLPLASTSGALWFDLAVEQRIATHATLWPSALFVTITVLVVILLFRPYLSRVIVQPLGNIASGLKKVEEGRLDHVLDQTSKDEFADISAGFNHMIRSLDTFRHRFDEQTELLESELTYRTVEAAKKIDPDILSKDQLFEQSLRSTIEDNMSNANFQVAELADAMATSTRQLHRRVVNLTAQTPAALIRNLRLEHGHMLLSAKAVTVSEAAYKVGFKDVSYFSKLFHKKYDITPSELLTAE